jgi:Zn-dependent oligopeptidase
MDLRKRQAKFFGYKNFAEMAIEGKSATSLENVIDMFEK